MDCTDLWCAPVVGFFEHGKGLEGAVVVQSNTTKKRSVVFIE